MMNTCRLTIVVFSLAKGVLAQPAPHTFEVASFGPPSINTALQEQLGVKLVTSKGPVQMIVIDHAELPSAN